MIKTIENLYKFLFFENIKLTSFRDFKEERNYEKVTSIIINDENLYNLTIFNEPNLINLKTLILSNNNIVDISPLKKVKFINLEYLNLECNKINNENIQHLKELNFPMLLKLNVFSNNFTDIQFFKNLSYFQNLNILYAGENKFDESLNEYNDSNYNLSKIKEIGLTKGAFSEIFIRNLSNFNISNVLILFLSKNNLSSLSFIEKIESPNLKEIWLDNNYINEFMPLIKFKKLKYIDLENNIIDNIDNLTSFLNEVTFLEKMNLKGNRIELKKKKIEELLKDLRSEIKAQLIIN